MKKQQQYDQQNQSFIENPIYTNVAGLFKVPPEDLNIDQYMAEHGCIVEQSLCEAVHVIFLFSFNLTGLCLICWKICQDYFTLTLDEK